MLNRNLLMTGLLLVAALATAQDWQMPVRVAASSGDLGRALAMVEQRLCDSPADLEAQGWRARLLAWSERARFATNGNP